MKGSRESAHCSAKSRCRIRAAIDLPRTGFSLIEVLIVIALIIGMGSPYYAVFGVLTIAASGALRAARDRRLQPIVPAVVICEDEWIDTLGFEIRSLEDFVRRPRSGAA